MLTNAQAMTFVLTRDRALSLPFYRDVLGLTLVGEDPFAATFDLAGTILRLTSLPDHTPSPHTVLGWEVPDIRAAVAQLRAKGVEPIIYEGFGQDADGVWSDGRAKIIWFADPEGNNLSLKEAS
ncbi:VOC family protein [Sandaracinobacteroides saxicola]|uniref:VOC family protein n=1 Tax=Sandaracinobacteroides saxicola TaxID=2759707 RepID=A0A7G5IL07_9SPHN|nr:VOC family protein [Sandaracinobacteroides saxicola]QMW24049.1 VOC family protein [Sandaracinobacteroides saxicola]